MARVFNQRHVHAKANPQKGNTLLSGKTHCIDFALYTAVTKSSWHQYCVQLFQHPDALCFNILSIDIRDLHPGIGLQPGVVKRFIQRFIRIHQINILSHHADFDDTLTLTELSSYNVLPFRQISGRLVEPKSF